MKRITAMLVAAGICLAGCSSNGDNSASAPQENPSITESVQETSKETHETEKASPAPTKRSLPPNVKTSRDRAEGMRAKALPRAPAAGAGISPTRVVPHVALPVPIEPSARISRRSNPPIGTGLPTMPIPTATTRAQPCLGSRSPSTALRAPRHIRSCCSTTVNTSGRARQMPMGSCLR